MSDTPKPPVDHLTAAADQTIAKAKARAAKAAPHIEPHIAGEPQAVPHVVKPLAASRVKLEQFSRNSWTVFAPEEMAVEDFEDPAAWTIVARDFRRYDRVAIVQVDRYSEAIVTDAGPNGACVAVLQSWTIPLPGAITMKALPDGYDIRAAQPGCSEAVEVIRLSDGHVMNKGLLHQTYEEARRWLLEHAIFRSKHGAGR